MLPVTTATQNDSENKNRKIGRCRRVHPKSGGSEMKSTPKKTSVLLLPSERKIELTFSRGFGYERAELLVYEWEPGVFSIDTTDRDFSRTLETRKDMSRFPNNRTFLTYGRWPKIRRLVDQFLTSAGDQFAGHLSPKTACKTGGSTKIAADSKHLTAKPF